MYCEGKYIYIYVFLQVFYTMAILSNEDSKKNSLRCFARVFFFAFTGFYAGWLVLTWRDGWRGDTSSPRAWYIPWMGTYASRVHTYNSIWKLGIEKVRSMREAASCEEREREIRMMMLYFTTPYYSQFLSFSLSTTFQACVFATYHFVLHHHVFPLPLAFCDRPS